MKRFILAYLLLPFAAFAQQPGQLPRTTGIADSTLFVCSDSIKTGSKACKFSLIQQRLSYKPFDSLKSTAYLRGGNGTGAAPTYSFTNSTSTGFYRFGADTIGVATAGVASLGIRGGATPTIFGGAGNMIIQAGTGNSRTMTLQTTTSAGAVKNTLVLGADSSVTSLGQIIAPQGTASLPGFSLSGLPTTGLYHNAGGGITMTAAGTDAMTWTNNSINAAQRMTVNIGTSTNPGVLFGSQNFTGFYAVGNQSTTDSVGISSDAVKTLTIGGGANAGLVGGAGNMTLLAGTGNNRNLILQSSNSTGTGTTFATGAGDTLKFGGHAIATGFTAASGTPGSICYITATSELTKNNATSCVVSARRFKTNIQPLDPITAHRIVTASNPVTYSYKDGGRKALGMIAEEADSVDHRLAAKNPDGQFSSIYYEEYIPAILVELRTMEARLRTLEAFKDSVITASKKKP